MFIFGTVKARNLLVYWQNLGYDNFHCSINFDPSLLYQNNNNDIDDEKVPNMESYKRC